MPLGRDRKVHVSEVCWWVRTWQVLLAAGWGEGSGDAEEDTLLALEYVSDIDLFVEVLAEDLHVRHGVASLIRKKHLAHFRDDQLRNRNCP